MKFEIEKIVSSISITLPIRTKSEANSSEHWRIKYERHRKQKMIIFYALKPHKDKIKLPCKITLIRFAPRKLDAHDNLPMSFKYIVDAICSIITGNYLAGNADSDDRITIVYDQITSKEYGIRIDINF